MGRDSVSVREHNYGVRIAVLEERWKGSRRQEKSNRRAISQRDKDYRKYIEGRLKALNGEAARLKTILESSVSREKFEDYEESQRKAQEEYRRTQSAAFSKYADEVGQKLANINKQIARWSGGIAAVVVILQLWLKYGGK
jgi:multidrug resistance efflux pump